MKRILPIVICAAAVMFASCGKKEPMTINATGDNIAVYGAAFKKNFDVTTVDAGQSGFGLPDNSTRYVVNVFYNMADIMPGEDTDTGNRFLVCVEDNGGESVQIAIRYSVGAASENPAVVNPNLLAGSMTMDNQYTFTPKEKTDRIKRVEQIASAIQICLDEAQGKDKK